jgi:hypothetical protein
MFFARLMSKILSVADLRAALVFIFRRAAAET